MKKNMSFPIRFWATILAGLLLYQFSTAAEAGDCKYEKTINLTLDLSNSESLAINALAGDLKIDGIKGSEEAVIEGHVCVSKEDWLQESKIETKGGKNARIDVVLPEQESGWSFSMNHNKHMDLKISVPSDIALIVRDSSGDVEMKHVGSVNITDSSGGIEIEHSTGPVIVRDSSGEIEISHVSDDVIIESDSSGSIEIEDVDGNAIVKKDSSGEIEFDRISGDAIVENDSSGSISANEIGGDFRVEHDGSGSINSSDIKGEIDIPRDK
jgi:hypothetical protein